MVDARLPDGSRVNVIFPPLTLDSPCISIRKFPSRRYGLEGMVDQWHDDAGDRPAVGDRRAIPAECLGLRRHRFWQDDHAERHEPNSSITANGLSPSRMRRSYSCSSRMSFAWKPAHQAWKAPDR